MKTVVIALLFCTASLRAAELGLLQPLTGETFAPAHVQVQGLSAVATSYGYLAVWAEPEGMRAVRVTRQGRVLDDPPIVIASGQAVHPLLASDGDTALVVFSHPRSSSDAPWIVKRVTADGAVEDLPDFAASRFVALYWMRDAYVAIVAWPLRLVRLDASARIIESRLLRSDIDERSLFIDRTGALQFVRQDAAGQRRVRRTTLVDAGGRFHDASEWDDFSADLPRTTLWGAGPTARGMYLVFYDPDASSLILTDDDGNDPIRVSSVSENAVAAPCGDDLIVVDDADGAVRVSRIAPDGGSQRIAASPPYVWGFPRPVSTEDATAVLWEQPDPRMRLIRNGRREKRAPFAAQLQIPLTRGIADQQELDAAAVGDGMIAVWSQPGRLGHEVHALALDASGHATGEPHFVMRGTSPLIASSGESAFVVARNGADLVATRIDRDARVVDVRPSVLPQQTARAVSWDGEAFVVQLPRASAVRFAADGRLLDREPLRLAALPAEWDDDYGTLGTSPAGKLFVFMQSRIGGDDLETLALFAQNLTADLKPVGEPFVVSVLPPHTRPHVLWRGDHYVVLYTFAGMLRASRVSADGVLLDGDIAPALEGTWSYDATFAATRDDRVLFAQNRGPLVEWNESSPPVLSPFGVVSTGRIVTTRDGRVWVFSIRQAGNAPARAWLQELFVNR